MHADSIPRRPSRARASAATLAALACVTLAPATGPGTGPGRTAASDAGGFAAIAAAKSGPSRLYLPVAYQNDDWPNPSLAEVLWIAVEAFVAAHPEGDVYPAADGAPTLGAAAANVDFACADFPDMDGVPFGPGAHHRACYAWVAEALGLYHGVAARRAALEGAPAAGASAEVHAAWAARYLDVALHHLAMLAYGPEDAPGGEGHRDTLAAIWQNPQRAVDIALVADLVRARGALTHEARGRVEELLAGIERAWMVHMDPEGRLPSHGVRLTTRTAPEHVAHSPAGRQMVSSTAWTFDWNADKGSSPAEELAWMGAGAILSARVLEGALPAEEIARLRAAGERYASFALSFDRLDPVTGNRVRTLNAETEGGAHGQNALWIENHTDDVPAIPYLGWTWYYLGAALLGAGPPGAAVDGATQVQRPWPGLVPDAAQWSVLVDSAEATLHAPDGSFLIDLTPGGHAGFSLDTVPGWTTDCGAYRRGTHYPRYDGRDGGAVLWVSEIGHSGGLDLLAVWPLHRLAHLRGDRVVAARWAERISLVTSLHMRRPPNPAWAVCGVAPYVSHAAGYHWPRMLTMLVMPYMGASGYALGDWRRPAPAEVGGS